jgi:predicted nucleotide-binding protein (sugar kinase/HSP70/actin superfamily)
MTRARSEDRSPLESPDPPRSDAGGEARPIEAEIRRRVEAARARLERRAGLPREPLVHYHRQVERPFRAAERDDVTILIGGLTFKHERLIQAGLQACGYHCEPLPQPDLAACLIGKQFGNNGLCNPAYFTVGNLIAYLQGLEAQGLSRQEIIDRHVFFTAGACGPCRFGMYEAEYRLALRNAGFDSFRVLTFQQDHGIKANTGEPGFQFSLLLGMGALNAFQIADILNDFGYSIRPYEVVPGATDRLVGEATELVATFLRTRTHLVPRDLLPERVATALARRRPIERLYENLSNIVVHLYGAPLKEALAACRRRLSDIEVDRLRVKPIVKVTGEFWAQTTEGDGNYRMFEFLEREGAHAVIDPLGAWVMYLLNQERAHLLYRRGLDVPRTGSVWRRLRARWADDLRVLKKRALFGLGDGIYRHRYDWLRRALGDVPHPLADQRELARLAHPYFHSLARGGEGHLEVGKNIYYSTRAGAHMVLSLKPFGCMPSTQSDAVQSSVVARFKDMIFLPIETAAEGELNAHSRVQMTLVEARVRAQAEFEHALASTGKRLDDIRRYVDEHRELRDPFHPVPHRPGIVGVAANFVLHVSDLIDRDKSWRRTRVAVTPGLRPSAHESTP